MSPIYIGAANGGRKIYGTATSNPGSATEGDIYWNSNDNVYKYYDGSSWQTVANEALGESQAFAASNAAAIYAEFDGSGHLVPGSNDARDLGTTGKRWRNIYVNDLQLSNEAKKDKGGNDVDGTWGDWTLQEGDENIFMLNNRTGKKYKMNLTEVE